MVAGRIASGKTSISRRLVGALGAGYASFGDEVRERAHALHDGISDRRSLQDLGERLVRREPVEFVEAGLARSEPPLDSVGIVVIDGVRHLAIAGLVKRLLADRLSLLIYIETSREVRMTRASRHGAQSNETIRSDDHANEAEVDDLRDSADLVVGGDDDAGVVAQRILQQLEEILSPVIREAQRGPRQ